MEFSNNSGDSDSVWTAFEHLEEIENVVERLEDLAIPDATYRQIKELNLALIDKAKQLANAEKEIHRQKDELELEKKNFEAIRIQCSRDTTETRLGRLIKIDQAYVDGVPFSADNLEDHANSTQSIDNLSIELDDQEDQGQEILFHHDLGPHTDLGPHSDLGPQSALDDAEREELSRFQSSAQNLRQKSEMISAIFVELDQMVRDLGRQQELLEELKLNPDQKSATELDRVNDKLKRRFRRLSRQINPQSN